MNNYNYTDIIEHPRYQLKNHKPMPLTERAVQFSPFAALTGFDDEIDETARYTDEFTAMSDDRLDELNKSFQLLIEMQYEHPLVTIIYFKPDNRKAGGTYVTYKGNFRFFDKEEEKLKFTDGTNIPVKFVSQIKFNKE
ncbi:MAG: hypothetical protein IJY19_06160 [Ruminococcus sp.]|nr:hypothetical protein [Ruminococcus sp.]